MAFLAVDNSWSGLYAQYIILKALYSMDTLEKGIVAVDSDIKKVFTIDRLDLVNPLSPSQAIPTNQPGSGWTMDSRTMTPANFQTFQVANPRDLETTVWSKYLAKPILEEILPSGGPDISGKMVQILLGRSGEQIENMFWMGSLAYAGHYVWGQPQYQLQYFNGYLQRMVSDPQVNLSTITPAVLTNTTVFAVLDDLIQQAAKLYKALISDKNSHRDMKFLCSITTWILYKEQLANTQFKGGPLDESGTPTWKGWSVVPLAGMPDNTIVFSRASVDPNVGNFHVAMNSEADWNLRIGQLDGNIFAEQYAMLAKWKFDVNYGWSDMIFLYTTYTAASFLPPVVTPQ